MWSGACAADDKGPFDSFGAHKIRNPNGAGDQLPHNVTRIRRSFGRNVGQYHSDQLVPTLRRVSVNEVDITTAIRSREANSWVSFHSHNGSLRTSFTKFFR